MKSLYLRKTIASMIASLGFGLLIYLEQTLEVLGRSARNMRTLQDLYQFLAVFGAIGAILFGRQALKTLTLYFKYRDISKDIQEIGDALLNTLIRAEVIHTDISSLNVITSIDSFGCVYCHLEGATTFEKSIFINSLQEIVQPIDNPRYVIIRKAAFWSLIKQKDYHAVPEVIGRNKELAVHFKNEWKRLVGSCDLIFTRSIEGRKLLLKARLKSLSKQFYDGIEHVSKWR